MSKGGVVVLIVAALVFSALGFVFGRVVQAASNIPGPVPSQSWVEGYVGDRLAAMQQEVDKLQALLLQYTGGSIPVDNNTDIPSPDDNPSVTPPVPPAPATVKVKDSGINVRSDASESASIVGTAAANSTLTYLDKKNDSQGRAWYKVRLDSGTEGWVAGWLCNTPE